MSVSKAIILSTLAVASATDELKAIADKINSIEGATWRAEKSSRFNSVEEIKRLLGSNVRKGDEGYIALPEGGEAPKGAVPSDFDARTGFPACASIIGHIRDQSACVCH